MRIRSVTIRGFRAFNVERRFNLASTNVFCGRNGYGKTSFFDAIGWCLFGTVQRLSGTRDFSRAGDVCQNKFASHAALVCVELETTSGRVFKRIRTRDGCRSFLNTVEIPDREFLAEIGFGAADAQDTFYRTYHLEQERLNSFVRDSKPRSRYDSMVSLLKLGSIDELAGRVGALKTVLSELGSELRERAATAEARLTYLQGDIAALTSVNAAPPAEVVKARYASLREAFDEAARGFGTIGFGDDDIPTIERNIPVLMNQISTARQDLTQLLSTTNDLLSLARRDESAPEDLETELENATKLISYSHEGHDALSAGAETLRKNLTDLDLRIAEEKRLQARVQSVLADVRQLVTADFCPICLRPLEKEKIISTIDDQIGKTGTDLSSLIGEREKLAQDLATNQQDLAKKNRDLAQLEQTLRNLKEGINKRQEYDRRLREFRTSEVAIRWNLSSLEPADIETRAREAIRLLEAAQIRAIELNKFLEELRSAPLLPQKESQLTEIRQTYLEAKGKIDATNSLVNMLAKCGESLADAKATLVSTALESYKPLIRNLYARLQPHPLFTEIDFEVFREYGEAGLYFRVFPRSGEIQAFPQTVFSASQLNALAVCIFLAMNIHASGPLKLMMLDDPIQAMDDINVLGFCDVLRRAKPSTQIFVSTHSKEFYRLLMSKLRPSRADDKVKGFQFESWTRTGPEIREEDLDFIGTGLSIGDVAKAISEPKSAA